MNGTTLKLLGDKEFLKKVLPMTPEDALNEFKKQGSDITLDEINELGATLKKVQENGGELNENELDNVAGGGKFGEFVVGFCVGAGHYGLGAAFLW